MKRFVLLGVISSIVLASCQKVPQSAEPDGSITFRIVKPLESTLTKSGSMPDTNAFILTVKGNSGDTLYSGKYGQRPAEISVPSGTYEISLISREFDVPEFESPQYGDHKVIVVSNGERVVVSFLCKQLNSGVKLSFTQKFTDKFSGGQIMIVQEGSKLPYSYTETRIAYIKAANVDFFFAAGDSTQALFSRTFGAGEIHFIELDASTSKSESSFSIVLDTTVVRITEKILIGDGYYGGDGSTAATALTVNAAKSRTGETVWVWGYIVGGDMSTSSMSFTGPFTKNTHFAIAADASETLKANCFSVGYTKEAIRGVLNLVDNPSNLGRKVFVKGKIDSAYFGVSGIKAVSDYQFE